VPHAVPAGAGAAQQGTPRRAAVRLVRRSVDLDDLADRHRGETVLVVGDPAYGPDDVLVEIDSDGLRVTAWDRRTVR
jgi:hypothetical protein